MARRIEKLYWVVLILIFGLLLYTVLRSALLYQFDNDEYYHSQIVYLLNHGNTMYTSFYTPYTPIFYWLLQPVFHGFGYDGFHALYAARVVMIGLFLFRLLMVFLIVRLLVSWKAGFFAVFLTILDPFMVMSGMQIRPDSLMLFVFVLAIFFYVQARKKDSGWLFFLSGILGAFSLGSLMKILPSIIPFLGIAGISAFFRKRLMTEGLLFLGFFLGISGLFVTFMISGQFSDLIRQTIIDPFTVFSVFLYPVPYGFYQREGNMWIFGPWNRSIPWMYAQLIAPLAGFGIFAVVQKIQDRKSNPILRDMLLILFAALILQWIWIISVQSIFMQYYLPFHWIIAVLAGIGIALIFENKAQNLTRIFTYLGVFAFFTIFTYGSIATNVFRSNIQSTETFKRIVSMWEMVPKDAPVFPTILFRPFVYPPTPYHTIFPGELPNSILLRYPSVRYFLEEKNVRYLYNDTGIISSLSDDDEEYIRSWFVPSGMDDNIFIRKKN
ncbi:MAG: glycosyltransferase family 39 protein [Patescibacteria group bacterium]|nr:glycosyltransferase family 39 protein [Patescibacteria group bacterium]